MSSPSEYKRIVLAERPVGDIDAKTFRHEKVSLSELKPGAHQVLVKVNWLSIGACFSISSIFSRVAKSFLLCFWWVVATILLWRLWTFVDAVVRNRCCYARLAERREELRPSRSNRRDYEVGGFGNRS